MLMYLRSSLHADMISCMHTFNRELQVMGNRKDHVETKIGEFATTANDLVDAHNTSADELDWIKAKIEDMEDRFRCNNVKIRGIPERVQPQCTVQVGS